MARFEGRDFRNQRVIVEGNEYVNCTFEDCVMVISGAEGKSAMLGNRFGSGITWTFDGAAGRTLEFLTALYHGFGDHGREQVEEIFATIRRSRPR
jgi:hypothetical protein